ncbi:MAG: hypothetical protein HQL82_00540 [Magnetococcales bacterium]|nr:hypothetical protein [Magnetococcales bacterium]
MLLQATVHEWLAIWRSGAERALAPSPWGRRMLMLGLAVFLGLRLAGMVMPWQERAFFPLEADDAAGVILHSMITFQCLHMDCQALQDFHHQVTLPSADPTVTLYREMGSTLIIPNHLPLQTLAIYVLNRLGLEWWTAFNVFQLFSMLVFTLGLCALLAVQWGPLAAGLGLMALGVSVDVTLFSLNVIGSNNTVLGLAMLATAWFIRHGRGNGWWLVAATWLMCLTHLGTGLVFASVLVAVWLLGGPWPRGRDWLVLALAVLPIVLVAIIPHLVAGKILGVPLTRMGPGDPGYWPGILGNLQQAVATLRTWMHPYLLNKFTLLALIGALAFLIPPHRRRGLLPMALMVAAALTTLGVVYAVYRADVFGRIFVPVAGWLSGGLAFLGLTAWQVWRQPATPRPGRGVGAVAALLALAVATGWSHQMVEGASWRPTVIRQWTDRQNYPFDPNHARLLQDPAAPCRRVLYDHRLLMGAFIIHGAHPCATVDLPSMIGSEQEPWIFEVRDTFTHLVRFNPLNLGAKGYPLHRGPAGIRSRAGAAPVTHLQINLVTDRSPAVVGLFANGAAQPLRQWTLPAGFEGWKVVADLPAGRLELRLLEGQAFLAGILPHPPGPDGLHWPWNGPLELDHVALENNRGIRRGMRTTYDFRPGRILPTLELPVTVLADSGLGSVSRVSKPDRNIY